MKYLKTLAVALAVMLAAAVAFAGEPSVKALHGAVEISNPGDERVEVAVYGITGALVETVSVEAGEEIRLELAPGYYIVKVDKLAKRVAIR